VVIRKLANEPYGMLPGTGPTNAQDHHAVTSDPETITVTTGHPHRRPASSITVERAQIPVQRKEGFSPSRVACARSCATIPTGEWWARIRDSETAQPAVQRQRLTGHWCSPPVHPTTV